MLPENAPYEEGFDVEGLTKFDLSGGQINLIVKNCAYAVATQKEPLFTMAVFIEEIQKEKKGNFDSEKSMGFLA